MPLIISQRRVANIKSKVALEAAKAYLNACLKKHHICRMQDVPLLLTRVLDTHVFQTASGSCIRLYSSKTAERGHYTALSYCWGGRKRSQLPKQLSRPTLKQSSSIVAHNLSRMLSLLPEVWASDISGLMPYALSRTYYQTSCMK
jgi:hypothetical protein